MLDDYEARTFRDYTRPTQTKVSEWAASFSLQVFKSPLFYKDAYFFSNGRY